MAAWSKTSRICGAWPMSSYGGIGGLWTWLSGLPPVQSLGINILPWSKTSLEEKHKMGIPKVWGSQEWKSSKTSQFIGMVAVVRWVCVCQNFNRLEILLPSPLPRCSNAIRCKTNISMRFLLLVLPFFPELDECMESSFWICQPPKSSIPGVWGDPFFEKLALFYFAYWHLVQKDDVSETLASL